MSKKKFIEVAAAIFGFTSDRVEKMTAEEQARLGTYGEQANALMTAKEAAIAERDTATARVTELEASLKAETSLRETSEAAVTAHEATIAANQERITELEAQVAERDKQISNLPGADATSTTKEKDADFPDKKETAEEPKYQTSADRELAEKKAKLNFKL